ncbi:hypothetical protein BDW74DRAFT_177239 [Aspergillus multicolor]|uniref:Rieske (2Fe-2S) protein n=1 Tax=Aspergillus multicolor TaxID=41759 RepID=UPI003CCDB4CA
MHSPNELIQDEQGWYFVGAFSSFEDVDHLGDGNTCPILPGCNTFHIPKPEQPDKPRANQSRSSLDEQVLVFKYKGTMHAIDNKCPHSSFPLKQGTIFDIEDVGPGIKCFRHGWTFDLFSGRADRGNGRTRLSFWDIKLRDLQQPRTSAEGENDGSTRGGDANGDTNKEVWVRRKH